MSIRDKIAHYTSLEQLPDTWTAAVLVDESEEAISTNMPSGFGVLMEYKTVLQFSVYTRCNSVQWEGYCRKDATTRIIREIYKDQLDRIPEIISAVIGHDEQMAVRLLMDLRETMK